MAEKSLEQLNKEADILLAEVNKLSQFSMNNYYELKKIQKGIDELIKEMQKK